MRDEGLEGSVEGCRKTTNMEHDTEEIKLRPQTILLFPNVSQYIDQMIKTVYDYIYNI